MKTVLISIRAKWWKLILSGKKTVEIRKTAPAEIDFPFRAIVYVPKVGIVGLFDCEGITRTNLYDSLAERSCLTAEQISKYAGGGKVCGWLIEKGSPVEFDNPLPVETSGQTRPPQSWCYIPNYRANLVSYSFDNETYGCTYANTAEALKDAAADLKSWAPYYQTDGKKIYVGTCEFFKPCLSACAFDAVESVICQADDEGFGEWADDYLSDVTKEQYQELEEQLDAVFNAWIEKNGLHAGFYKINSYSEYLFDKAEGEFVTPEIYYSRRAKKNFRERGKNEKPGRKNQGIYEGNVRSDRENRHNLRRGSWPEYGRF